jgi:hypothetical protein
MRHLRNNNETYLSHFVFGFRIGLSCLATAFFFIIHSIFPFVPIPKKFNIEAMNQKFRIWHAYTAVRKTRGNKNEN